jgi:hypothetical protein
MEERGADVDRGSDLLSKLKHYAIIIVFYAESYSKYLNNDEPHTLWSSLFSAMPQEIG